jgi:chromosome segregation protein
MLKRLELVGFKSFADRTWFSFPPGLTAVVGPNGSGKSNVVDAVKWILGEQRAKSLRGGEMADVIFNGSSSRRALGMAEVTLTLDNSVHNLNTDAAEIAVTRRVHRDGTGEYLINGQPSRLKDVRELFLGSGAGSMTYCIIEQGRVDALLQAGPRDRRAIFEEAAGTSRFKAKKQETLRKLDHTNENLTRLRDILGEVEARLRRVRLDAEKAHRFQEYGGRLRELRLGIGLREYHALTQQLTTETVALDGLRGEQSAAAMQAAVWESEARQIEEALGATEGEIARATDGLSDVRRQIATLQERQAHEAVKATEIEAELTTAGRRSVELAQLISGLEVAAEERRAAVAAAEGEAEVRRSRAADLDAAAADAETELAALRKAGIGSFTSSGGRQRSTARQPRRGFNSTSSSESGTGGGGRARARRPNWPPSSGSWTHSAAGIPIFKIGSRSPARPWPTAGPNGTASGLRPTGWSSGSKTCACVAAV